MNIGVQQAGGAAVASYQPVPLRLTQYTSGTGTFTPLGNTRWMRVTVLGGGAGGNSSSGAQNNPGGKAAIPVTFWVQKTASSYSYSVGAGGTGVGSGTGNSGSNTTFGTLTGYGALGGNGGGNTTFNGEGNQYGQGGIFPLNAATGFGAGGAGTGGSGTAGGSGTGGLIIIEEY